MATITLHPKVTDALPHNIICAEAIAAKAAVGIVPMGMTKRPTAIQTQKNRKL